MKPYQALVERQRARNPCLSMLCKFLASCANERNACKIVSLDFVKGSLKPQREDVEERDIRAKLIHRLDKERDEILQGRLLIIEDLNPNVIEVLGNTLNVDPLFFASHIHAPGRGQTTFQTPESSTAVLRIGFRPELLTENIRKPHQIAMKRLGRPQQPN